MKAFPLKIYFLLTTIFFAIACSKDNSESSIIVVYDEVVYSTKFRTIGSTGEPTVDWQGNEGFFGLKTSIQGVSIDPQSGVVFWDESLPPGINEIIIEASNNKTLTSIAVEIESTLADSFWNGGQNSNADSREVPNNLHLWLSEDGTVQVEDPGNVDANGVGTWEFQGNEFEIHYCNYCPDINPVDVPNTNEHTLLRGILTNTLPNAYLEGFEYVKFVDPDSESLRGYFYLEWD